MLRYALERRLFFGFLAATWLLLASAASHGQVALAPGDQAPSLTGRTFPAKTRYQSDWSRNKLTLINFWATWCEPCKKEMPVLQVLFEAHVVDGFRIVGVFERWELEHVPKYLALTPVTYTIIRPDPIIEQTWSGVRIKPTSFLVDETGKILRRYVGASEEQIAGLAADVKALLEGRPMPMQVLPPAEALPESFKERMRGNKPGAQAPDGAAGGSGR